MEERFQPRTPQQSLRLLWSLPPDEWAIGPDEVHCWAARLDCPPEQVQALTALLSDEERRRASRLRFDESRSSFIVARALLRKILSRYVALTPREILFFYTATGKPILAPWFGKAIQFNVSHSGQLALYAVSINHNVGVDVERIVPIAEAASIARRFFTREEAEQIEEGTDGNHEFFYRIWTRKEAILKCSGEGITEDPAAMSLLPGSLVSQLEPAPGFVGAVAVNSPTSMKLQTWRWEDLSVPALAPSLARHTN